MPAPLPPAAAKPAGKVVKPVGNAPPPGAQAELAPADEQKESISGFPASATASDASGVLRDLPLPPQPSLEARQQAPAKAAPSPAANVSPSAARAESAVPTPPAPRSLSSRSPTLGRQTMADLNADFWQAAKDGRSQQLEQLVGQGVPVNVRDSEGRTALMLAAINGQTSAVQKLLALGADPRLLDRDGMTAAQQARRLGHVGVAELIEARS